MEWGDFTEDQLDEVIVRAEQGVARLRALELATIAEKRRRRTHIHDGYRSIIDWVGMDISDLWAETTEARRRFEEAETAAEQARSVYHELIRLLNTSGVSVREIATRLELSHQRVHQIVSGAACGFCERRRADVARLVAGPGVFICDSCTALGLHALAQGWGASDERTRMEVRNNDELRCCFCRKRSQKVGALAARGGMRICGHCLTLATREFDRSTTPSLKRRPDQRRHRDGLDRMTDRARQALSEAEAAARALRRENMTDEHLFLGLLEVKNGLAARALTGLGVTPDDARQVVVGTSPPGTLPVEGPMPIDPTLKRHIFEAARSKSSNLGHNYIGTEHRLLALVDESSSVGDILTSLDVDPHDVRTALMDMLRQQGIVSWTPKLAMSQIRPKPSAPLRDRYRVKASRTSGESRQPHADLQHRRGTTLRSRSQSARLPRGSVQPLWGSQPASADQRLWADNTHFRRCAGSARMRAVQLLGVTPDPNRMRLASGSRAAPSRSP